MKYQGIELSEYNSEYLAQQMGMLNMVKKIFLGIFVAGACFSIPAAIENNSFLVGLAIPVFCFLICGGPILYTHRMTKGMQEELDRRSDKRQKAQLKKKADEASGKQLVLTIVGLVILGFIFLLVTTL